MHAGADVGIYNEACLLMRQSRFGALFADQAPAEAAVARADGSASARIFKQPDA